MQVAGERYGSLGNLVESVASQRAAPSRAHLNAINNRRRGENEKNDTEKKPERISEKVLEPLRLLLIFFKVSTVSDWEV